VQHQTKSAGYQQKWKFLLDANKLSDDLQRLQVGPCVGSKGGSRPPQLRGKRNHDLETQAATLSPVKASMPAAGMLVCMALIARPNTVVAMATT
jgi:hypothetical protein